jgi:hypothetical protein
MFMLSARRVRPAEVESVVAAVVVAVVVLMGEVALVVIA